nr:MAG TPA: hypothetical protein [Bacteriophage sp.]
MFFYKHRDTVIFANLLINSKSFIFSLLKFCSFT